MKDRITGEILYRGTNSGDVYCLQALPKPQLNAINKVSLQHWHCHLGHPALPITQRIINNLGFSISNVINNKTLCTSCAINKSHQLPFSTNTLSSSDPLDLLYTKVWGPSPIPSSDGYRYYVTFIDHFTKYIWFYPISLKSDVLSVFQKFRLIVEKYCQRPIKVIHSDGGGEYTKLGHYLSSEGISHLISPPYTPQRNGFAERRHRHIVETGITLLSHASMPSQYWSFAFQMAVYLINRLSTLTLKFSSPFEILHKTSPNYAKLRIFGCLCFPVASPLLFQQIRTSVSTLCFSRFQYSI